MLDTALDSKLLTVEALSGPHRGMQWRFTKPEIAIGRARDNDVVLEADSAASRRHATLRYSEGEWEIRDEGSSNGTFVRLASQMCKIRSSVPVRGSSQIQVGETSLMIEARD